MSLYLNKNRIHYIGSNRNIVLRANSAMSLIQERIIILQNSVKFLERLIQNLKDQKNFFLTEIIQKRIKSYKEELQLHEKFLI